MKLEFRDPTVKVVKDSYKPNGDFSVSQPCTPIFDEQETLCGVTRPRQMTYIHSYGAEGQFFKGIAHGRLLGTRCDNPKCEGHGTVYLPFRTFCPDCLEKNTVVDLTDVANKTARIHTCIVTSRTGAYNPLPTPIRFVDVEFDGVATILKGYMVGPGEPSIGMRVVPVFKTGAPTYEILDMAFAKEGVTQAELPEGFTFSK